MTTRSLLPLLAFAVTGFATPSFGQSASGHLIVVNKADSTIGIIDPVAGVQLAAIPAGGFTPHEVAVSPDGRFAYAPIYGSGGVATPGTDGTTLAVIDLDQRKVVGNVDFGHGVRPHLPVFNPVDGLLYVTTEIDKTITIIDPKTLKIVGTIPTTQAQSHLVALSHDGKRAYTDNVGPGTITVLDLNTRKPLTVIPISGNTQRISISTDDKLVFTADQTKPQLAVVDTATNRVTGWIPLPATGYGAAPTPDGKWLLVALPATNQVAIIDIAALKVMRLVDVATAPQAIIIRPDGKEAYASCIRSNQVAAIDLSTWAVRLIAAGKGVDGMAWAK